MEIKVDNFKQFIKDYRGALIGALIGILVLLTNIYKLIIGIILVFVCMFIGNYVQHNKNMVKEKLKSFIDRI